MRKAPPAKRPGHSTGRRRIDGIILDVSATALYLGESEHAVRAQVARRQLPFRKRGGRIIFLTSELDDFLARLPGIGVDAALANVAHRSNGAAP